MNLRQIADTLGLGEYAPELDRIYEALPQDGTPACSLETIDWLQADYNTFGEFYELVRAIAIQINNDPIRSAWIRTAAVYAQDHTRKEINKIPVPPADGTVVTSMLPLYIIVSMLPAGVAEYRRRGFSEKEIGLCMHRIWDGLRIVKRQTGMPGINQVYYRWQTLFAKARIFEFEEGLQFEIKQVHNAAIYLRSKESGQIIPVLCNGTVHRSGLQMLGSPGYKDPEGSFDATFTEDEENFYGYGCYDGKVETQQHTYPKSLWEVHLRPGDHFLSLHIPEGADISLDTLIPQLKKAREVARTRFPENKCYDIFGSSWLFDHRLLEIVKPESNIARLMALFTRYPVLNDGSSIFSFVFDRKPERLEDLPEDSSLRRGLKKMYLEGHHIHIYAGIVTGI